MIEGECIIIILWYIVLFKKKGKMLLVTYVYQSQIFIKTYQIMGSCVASILELWITNEFCFAIFLDAFDVIWLWYLTFVLENRN